jgi:hypothetical protein
MSEAYENLLPCPCGSQGELHEWEERDAKRWAAQVKCNCGWEGPIGYANNHVGCFDAVNDLHKQRAQDAWNKRDQVNYVQEKAELYDGLRTQAEKLGFRSIADAIDTAVATKLATIHKGWTLVPEKISDEMIEAAMEAHYGKKRVKAHGGAQGVDMTVNDRYYNGHDAMRRFWKGALTAIKYPGVSKFPTPKELRRLAESLGASPTESCDPDSKVVMQMTLAEMEKFAEYFLVQGQNLYRENKE